MVEYIVEAISTLEWPANATAITNTFQQSWHFLRLIHNTVFFLDVGHSHTEVLHLLRFFYISFIYMSASDSFSGSECVQLSPWNFSKIGVIICGRIWSGLGIFSSLPPQPWFFGYQCHTHRSTTPFGLFLHYLYIDECLRHLSQGLNKRHLRLEIFKTQRNGGSGGTK